MPTTFSRACGGSDGGARGHRRHRRQQLAGVLLLGCGEQLGSRPVFDGGPITHHQHVVAHLADHRQIVTDEQVAQTQLALQTRIISAESEAPLPLRRSKTSQLREIEAGLLKQSPREEQDPFKLAAAVRQRSASKPKLAVDVPAGAPAVAVDSGAGVSDAGAGSGEG